MSYSENFAYLEPDKMSGRHPVGPRTLAVGPHLSGLSRRLPRFRWVAPEFSAIPQKKFEGTIASSNNKNPYIFHSSASHLECLPVFPLVAMHSEKSAYAELKKLVGWPRCLTPVSGPGVWMPEAVWPEAGWVAPTWALLLALHSENPAYTELKKLVGWPRCLDARGYLA